MEDLGREVIEEWSCRVLGYRRILVFILSKRRGYCLLLLKFIKRRVLRRGIGYEEKELDEMGI